MRADAHFPISRLQRCQNSGNPLTWGVAPGFYISRLWRWGLGVLTQDGAAELSDSQLLDRSSVVGWILFTQDDDLLAEARKRQSSGATFVGLAYAHQLNISVGQCIADLELIASTEWPRHGLI